MSRFVLQPGRILQESFAVDRTKDPVERNFSELIKELVPDRDIFEAKKLGFLKQGCFVGTIRHPEIVNKSRVFLFYGVNGSGDMSKSFQEDPTLPERIEKIYRVDVAEYDSTFTELTPAVDNVAS